MFTEKTDITAKDIKRLLLSVYRRFRAGEITESGAYRETYLLNSVLKAIEVTDMEERLSKIENIFNDPNG